MKFGRPWVIPALISLTLGGTILQAPNLTGTWHLNVDKSKWGSVRKPVSVVLVIEHKEPQIQYHGSVTYANEETRDFGFFGAFDGKPYAMTRSYGSGTIVLHRLDPYSFESAFKTEDGSSEETAKTTLSRDGKVLTRSLRLRSPEGTKNWTEIYEKR
ncbi:MAG: hypothetical protein HZB13_07195 [Acidobacteria bacterium]|nr:hypothetical protein [Acidobacteriota bacterium]